MKRYGMGVVIAALCATAWAQTSRPAALADLQPFVGGEWRADAKWANGDTFKAVARFESILGGRYIQGVSSTLDDAGNPRPRDLVIFSDSHGVLTQHVFNADGNTRTATGSREEDGTLVFEWVRQNPDGTNTPLKQRIRHVDADTCQQQVLMHIRGDWHTLIDATWTRAKS